MTPRDAAITRGGEVSEDAILHRLAANDTLDEGVTLDAAEDEPVHASPIVFDPSEASVTSESEIPRLPTNSGRDALDRLMPKSGAGSTLEDKTSISPRPPTNRDTDEREPGPPPLGPTFERGPPTDLRATARESGDRPDTPSLLEPPPGERERSSAVQPRRQPGEDVRLRGLPPDRPPAPSTNRRARPLRTNGTNAALSEPGPARPRRIWEIRPDDPAAVPLESPPQGRAHLPSPIATPPPPASSFAPPAQEIPRPMLMPAVDALILSRIRSSLEVPATLLKDPRVMVLIAAVAGMLAVALLITILVSPGSSGASLHIVTEPTQQVEVRLDGKIIADETPVEARSLGIGQHTVELRANGYYAYSQVVEISESKPHTMVVPLEPVDPSRREGEERGQRPIEPSQAHDERNDRPAVPNTPLLEPVEASKRSMDAPPKGGASVPGPAIEESGPTPKPRASLGASEISNAPPKPETRAKAPKPDEGFLMVSTKPSGVLVIIDGKSTDLKTPVRRPHPLSAGRHVITFELSDGQRYSFEVTIAAGETKKLFKPLR